MPQMKKTRAIFVMAEFVISITSAISVYNESAIGADL